MSQSSFLSTIATLNVAVVSLTVLAAKGIVSPEVVTHTLASVVGGALVFLQPGKAAS